jgi:hypothetical protein
VSEAGRRCTERRGLQFHHEDPFGRGGDHDPHKISLMCERHNAYFAEREYGKEVMMRYRRNGDRVSETAPVYGSFEPIQALDNPPWSKDSAFGVVRDPPFRLVPGVNTISETRH